MPLGTDKRATGACPEKPSGFRDAASNAGRTYCDDRRNIRNSQHDPITREFRYSLHTVDVAKIDVYNNFCKRRNIASPVRKRIFLCVLFCKVVSWCDKIIGKSYDEIRV